MIVSHAALLAPSYNLFTIDVKGGSDMADLKFLEPLFRENPGPTTAVALIPLYLLMKIHKCLMTTLEFKICLPTLESATGDGLSQINLVSSINDHLNDNFQANNIHINHKLISPLSRF